MWIDLFYCVMGLASGMIVAAGLATFITSIGVVSRLAQVTHTAGAISWSISWYENVFVLGGLAGNMYSLYVWTLPLGTWAMGAAGLFIGIFLGCMIGGITEVLNAIPVFYHRAKLRCGLKALVWAIALGKVTGGIVDFLIAP